MSGLSSYAAQKWLDHCCKRKGLQSNQQHRCCIRHRLGLNSSKSVLQLYSQINRLGNYFPFSVLLRFFRALFDNANNSSLTFLY
ncbi:hypothetical protein T06_9041 [Trichinella sp. T6]|nr:hypothetical protein T06_9041 [Trichinella sp. T6]